MWSGRQLPTQNGIIHWQWRHQLPRKHWYLSTWLHVHIPETIILISQHHSTLKTEAVGSCKTFTPAYMTMLHYIPEVHKPHMSVLLLHKVNTEIINISGWMLFVFIKTVTLATKVKYSEKICLSANVQTHFGHGLICGWTCATTVRSW
jgi:hypothetical protein